jgi:hypothetical protein
LSKLKFQPPYILWINTVFTQKTPVFGWALWLQT